MAKRKRGVVRKMKQQIKHTFLKELPFFLSIPAIIWQLLFFYMPLIFIIFMSFKKLGSGVLTGFTLQNYAACMSTSFILILFRSLMCSFVTATLCLCIGYPVAYYLARKATRWKNTLLFFLVLPFWTNMLVQVYAWFAILERKGLLNNLLLQSGLLHEPLSIMNSTLAIYIVMVYYYLPFMVLPIFSVLEKLEDEYIEASLDLGATTLQTFFRVTLPLSMSGVTTGFFLVFVPAFGEFVIPGLMGGNKFMYIGSLIAYYYLNMRNEALGSACMVMSALILIVVSLVLYRFLSSFVIKDREL